MTYFIGDTHFCQDKLLQYNKRKFNSVDEMNEFIIKRWNNKVKENDIVYVLGDFSFGTFEESRDICNRLNGNKYLIKGNWDTFSFDKTYEEMGFSKLLEEPYEVFILKDMHLQKIILSHHPVETPENVINIHAHLHLDKLNEEFPNINPKNHICVSAERIGYEPITIKELKERGEI